MKLEHISLNLVLSFERGVHLFDFSSLYFSSSSFNFSLYFFVLSLLELMIYAIIYTSYERCYTFCKHMEYTTYNALLIRAGAQR